MDQIKRSKAACRIIGDSIKPIEISNLLGCMGTTMYSKGDAKIIKNTGKEIKQQSGHWSLSIEESCPENIDGQVSGILSKLTSDLTIWNELASKYHIELFCGLFMENGNESVNLSPEVMLELGKRRVQLILDIYDKEE